MNEGSGEPQLDFVKSNTTAFLDPWLVWQLLLAGAIQT